MKEEYVHPDQCLCPPDFVIDGKDGGNVRACRVRPARPDDPEAMFRCYRSTSSVLCVDEFFGGFVWLERGDEWWLRFICVLPEFQNYGIGCLWLRHLQARAATAGRLLRLNVFKTNTDAKRLYERLGFRTTGEDPHAHELVFDPKVA